MSALSVRKSAISLLAVIAAGLMTVLTAQSASAQSSVDISVTFDANRSDPGQYAYEPDNVSIDVGGTVTWENVDDLADQTDNNAVDHPTNCIKGESKGTCPWSSKDLPPGGTMTVTFPESGSFSYFCAVHPYMTGWVIVGNGEPPAAPEPTETAAPSTNPDPSTEPAEPAATETQPGASDDDDEPTATDDEGAVVATDQGSDGPDTSTSSDEGLPTAGNPDPAAQSGAAGGGEAADNQADGDAAATASDGDGSNSGLLIVAALLVLGVGGVAFTQFRKQS